MLLFTEEAERASMKEIKGLGERLFGLGQLVSTAKGILVNQSEMAQVICMMIMIFMIIIIMVMILLVVMIMMQTVGFPLGWGRFVTV